MGAAQDQCAGSESVSSEGERAGKTRSESYGHAITLDDTESYGHALDEPHHVDQPHDDPVAHHDIDLARGDIDGSHHDKHTYDAND